MNIIPDSHLLTEKELACRWGMSPRSLANERSLGRSKISYLKIGKAVRYRLSDVAALEDASLVKTGPRRRRPAGAAA